MRILFLSRWYPYPPDNGSKLRVFHLLHGLCARHDVTLVSFVDPSERRLAPTAESPAPGQTHVCEYREFQPGSGRAMLGLLSGTPRYLVDTHSPEMEALIRQVLDRARYDLVIASQLPMAAYYRAFRGVPAIFEEAELGVYWPDGDESRSQWVRARRTLTWAKHARFMARLLPHFALCTVASEVERRLLAVAAPGYQAVHVVPNSVSAAPADVAGSGRTANSLIFTGSLRFAPNRDAVTWFVDEIFPLVNASVPGVRVTVTGDPGPVPPALPPGVELAGHVADVRALLAASAIGLAPIRVGGGTRLKILDAMAVGTPVVATTKAAEGLDVLDRDHLRLADTPAAFAGAVCDLLRDPAAARAMADRARSLFQSRYDSKVVVPAFLRLVEEAAAA